MYIYVDVPELDMMFYNSVSILHAHTATPPKTIHIT